MTSLQLNNQVRHVRYLRVMMSNCSCESLGIYCFLDSSSWVGMHQAYVFLFFRKRYYVITFLEWMIVVFKKVLKLNMDKRLFE